MPVNFAASQVVTAPSPAISGTTLTLLPGDGAALPSVPFNAVIADSSQVTRALDPASEIVRVTDVTSDTLTIVRAQESTAARTIIVGDRVYAGVTEGLTTRYVPDLGPHSVVPGGICGGPANATVITASSYYALRVLIPSETTITGVRYCVGNTPSGNVRAALYDNTGATRLANRTVATGQSSANTFQDIAFDSPYSADPGIYHTLVWFSSGTAQYMGGMFLTSTTWDLSFSATPTSLPGLTDTFLEVPIMATF